MNQIAKEKKVHNIKRRRNDMEDNLMIYEGLGEDQKIEVQTGLKKGIDVSSYAKPEYLAIQMRQIRLGLEDGLDVSVYNSLEYDWFQMEEIRLGMKERLAYELYAKPAVDYKTMRQIRKGLQDGIDLSKFIKLEAGILEELRKAIKAKVSIVDYIKEGYEVEQLTEIRRALENKIDIRPYISTEMRGASIHEIYLGLEAGLQVSIYAALEYNWQQMREIRLGMESRIDVSQYSNSLYSWQQMREIRLGLEEGLEVETYKKFLFTASDMEKIRTSLLIEEAKEIIEDNQKQQVVDKNISIFLSKDEMEACIEISGDSEIREKDIYKKLRESGISHGILSQEIESIVAEKRYDKTIVIARGKPAQVGKDGWYEFFFDTNPTRTPKILEDGSVDYRDVKWFETVKKEQKLAYYHSATFGVAGFTVTGKFLKAKKGREKGVLRGKGFRLEHDGKTYYSTEDGRVVLENESRLEISRMLVLDNVSLATGNVGFDGTVYIRGNVGSGVFISATDNVIIDGYVESAMIRSGGEIFLRQGVNGRGNGIIESNHNVVGQFFEDVKIVAGGDIIGQYCMNCDLHSDGNIMLQGNKGLLLGGKARAAKGITAFSVGNRNALHTELYVGIDQNIIKYQQKINKDIENVHRELAILEHTKMDFQHKYSAEVRNTMGIYLKIENAIYTKELQLKQLLEEKETTNNRVLEMKGAKIVVKDVLHEGVEISIDNSKWKAFSLRDVIIKCKNEKIVVESQ